MTLADELLVSLFPSVANAGCLSIWNGFSVDRIGIMMIKDENVVVAATGRDWEPASLIAV
jgi:hypothetical protein